MFVFAAEPAAGSGAGGIGLPTLAPPGAPVVETTAPNNVPFAIVLTEVANILGGAGPVPNATSPRSLLSNGEDTGTAFSFITTRALDVEDKTKDDAGEPDLPPLPGGIGLGVEEAPKLDRPPVGSDPDGPSSSLQPPAPLRPGLGAPTGVDGFSGEWLAEALEPVQEQPPSTVAPGSADPAAVAEVSSVVELDSRQADAVVVEAEHAVGLEARPETGFEEAAWALAPLRPAQGEGWDWHWPLAVLVALTAAEPFRRPRADQALLTSCPRQ